MVALGNLSGPGTPATANDEEGVVYTLSNAAAGNAVLVFHRAEDGSLTPGDPVLTDGLGSGGSLGNQGAVVLSDDHNWLLAVNAGSNNISVFQVENGDLTLTDLVPSGGTEPISVTIYKDLVYVLNDGGPDGGTANISGFQLDSNGELAPLLGSTRLLSTGAPDAAQIEFSPNGKMLVVTEKATNMISVYPVDQDGLAHGPITQLSNGATPFGFAFDHLNRIFVSEARGGAPDGAAVTAYRVAGNGDLSILDGSEPTQETAACWVIVTHDGRYAYVTNTGSGTITGFSIAGNGDLTPLDDDGITAGEAGRAPLDAAISYDNRFLYVLNSGTDQVNGYAIEEDGSLTSLPDPVAVLDGSNGLAAK
jgi:6-phosphogluconolactonase (cycloisomerase 2 family)